MKTFELIQLIKEEIKTLAIYKAGDKFNYRGSEQTVIEDDGIIIKTKDKKGQERKFNHNQVKNQKFPKL